MFTPDASLEHEYDYDMVMVTISPRETTQTDILQHGSSQVSSQNLLRGPVREGESTTRAAQPGLLKKD